jgi:hypothetical protein
MDAPEGEIGGIADSVCRRHVEPIPVLGCEGPYRRFSVPYKGMRSGSDEAESSSQDRSRLSGARTFRSIGFALCFYACFFLSSMRDVGQESRYDRWPPKAAQDALLVTRVTDVTANYMISADEHVVALVVGLGDHKR